MLFRSAIVNALHTEILRALQTADVHDALAKHGVSAHAESPAQFTAFIKADRARMIAVAQQIDLKAE